MSAIKGVKILLHPVADLTAAKGVYVSLLGIQPQADSDYYVGFDLGGQHIGLYPAGPDSSKSPVTYFEVDDLDAKLAEVVAAGATVKEPPAKVGGSRRIATFTDLDGNVLGLVQD